MEEDEWDPEYDDMYWEDDNDDEDDDDDWDEGTVGLIMPYEEN